MNGLTPIRNPVALLVCTLAVLASIPSAFGQRFERRPEHTLAAAGGDRDAREMVEVVMMVRLSRELDLSEEETVLLVRRMSEFREVLGGLHRQRRRLMGALRGDLQEEGNEEEIRAKLEELKELDGRLNNIKPDLHEKLSEGLDERQQARLYLFLQDFEENMRRMVQRVRERSRAMESGRMGRGGVGRGGLPPQRMMRDRLPRGPEGREKAGRTDTGQPPFEETERDPS